VAEVLLKHGADANKPNKVGATPLYLACGMGRAPAFQLLLKYGADPLQSARDGTTCLHVAAERGLLPVIQAIVDFVPGATLEQGDAEGQTVAHFAARNNRAALLRELITMGASYNVRTNSTGATPLMLAAQGGAIDAMTVLLDAGADPNAQGNHGVHRASALYLAARRGHRGACRLLLDRGARVDIRLTLGTTAAFAAAERGDVPLLELLAERGANFNYRDIYGGSALFMAVTAKQHAAMEFLLLRGETNAIVLVYTCIAVTDAPLA
jgi:ankyrin repeat protein